MSRRRHEHSGGAWKVAYADFVTAMMALFIVLWLASQDQRIKEAVERSFRNPFASLTKESTGIIPNKDTQAVKSHEGNFDSASVVELNMLRTLADNLLKTLESNPETPAENPLNLEITGEGLRVTVFDRNRKAIFEPDSAEFTAYGTWVFSTLAWEIGRYTNGFLVELEGHTEAPDPQSKVQSPKSQVSGPSAGGLQTSDFRPETLAYGPWELSVDRASAARRKLLGHGVAPSQIRKVAGFADTLPLPKLDPHDETNRRVAVLLKIKSGKPR